ncbi:MAG: DUF507 family protein [Candidatus Rokubacteria bacterium]|nr:DUF507 family protein [Candidatus Rokubacteria bacterium]
MSRERIFYLADRIVAELQATPEVVVRNGDEEIRKEVRNEVIRSLTDETKLEESIEQEVRRILSSYARPVPEGSREWEVLYTKTREEVFRKRFRL